MLTLSSPAQNFYTITQTPGTESLQSLCVKREEMCDARGANGQPTCKQCQQA